MIEKYTRNGIIDRAAIAKDVKLRRLTVDEIKDLCENELVQEMFIGSVFSDKQPRQKWSKEYLDRLYYAVVAESFNLDYLLYLNEVADFVAKAKFKKIIVAGTIIVLVIVAGVIVLSYILA